ncbi:Hypothetical protein A7982_02629 [Minicystis rosea]|nr:Hypothetical protein A7982_02629 [Minicystis rosea]
MRRTSLIALSSILSLAIFTACGPGGGGGGGSGGSAGGTTSSTGGGACDKAPASGMTQIVPASGTDVEVGVGAAISLLGDGSPIVAYGVHHQTDGADEVFVIRWDSCAGAWTAPVKVDDVSSLHGIRPIGIAVDASDGRVVVTYEKSHVIQQPNPTHQIYVATSTDGGATFTSEPVSRHCIEEPSCTQLGDEQDAFNPQVAVAGGKTYVVYDQALVGCGTADPGEPPACHDTVVFAQKDGATWTRTPIEDGVDPKLGNTIYTDVTFPPSVAIDGDGVPGVLAFQHPNQSSSPISYTWALYFARPGHTGARVFDSKDAQNDVGTGSSSLCFEGTKAFALAHLHDQAAGTETHDLLFAASNDGASWATAVPLPRDGDALTAASQALLGDGHGGLVAVAQASDGSTNVFGNPKILRSADGASWSLDGASDVASGLTPRSVTAARAADGKLLIAFEGTVPASVGTGGVVVWREP